LTTNAPSLEQLRALLLVVETGSFSAAAARLDVSQPAVSLQVKELERKLGTRLVERVGRRAVATAAGAALLGYAREILALTARAVDAVGTLSEGVHGAVRLGVGATACLHFLPPLLGRLHQAHPQLQVVVSTGNTEEFARKVERNDMEFALVTLPAARRALTVETILRDPFVFIAPPGDSGTAALPRHVTPAQAAARALILFEPGTNTRKLADAWLRQGGKANRPAMELGSVEAIKEMVRAGLGCSIVPRMAVRPGDDATLQVRPLRPALSRELGLVVRHDKPLTRGMAVLADALRQAGRGYEAAAARP